MVRSLASLAVCSLLVVGCAHGGATSHETVVAGVREVVAVDTPPPSTELPPNAFANDDAAASRPRLSRTITLGQGGNEPVYGTSPSPGAPAAAAGSNTNVTVNNHVTVVQPPVYYYGGYGGYGYGGYGGGYGRGAGTNAPGSGSGRDGAAAPTPSSNGPWAPSGWEGAGRTAAPGATPGVGGNFAPPPSFGPRQMK